MFELQGIDFLLKFYEIYSFKNDLIKGVPNNGSFTLLIETNYFKGISELDINIKDLEKFFYEIVKLWTTLEKGETIIKEPYGYNQFILVKSNQGYFEISGELYNVKDDEKFLLKFSKSIDQSFLNNFISQIKCFKLEDYLK